MIQNLDNLIDSPHSPVFLSAQLMENGRVLKAPEEKARFILRHLNNESYARYSAAPQKIEPTLSAACVWLAKQSVAQDMGDEMTWFIYDKEQKACHGLVNLKKTKEGEFELGQIVLLRDYQARFGALKLLQENLEQKKEIKKLKVKVLTNNTDNVYHSYLRGLGYQVENITHNRLLNLGNEDYIIYAKVRKEAVPVVRAQQKSRAVALERILPCQYTRATA